MSPHVLRQLSGVRLQKAGTSQDPAMCRVAHCGPRTRVCSWGCTKAGSGGRCSGIWGPLCPPPASPDPSHLIVKHVPAPAGNLVPSCFPWRQSFTHCYSTGDPPQAISTPCLVSPVGDAFPPRSEEGGQPRGTETPTLRDVPTLGCDGWLAGGTLEAGRGRELGSS